MSRADVMREIEGPEFGARVSVVSDAEIFIEALRSEPAVIELLRLSSEEEVRNCLLARVQALVYERSDTRYRNARDIAIATYTWCLGAADLKTGNIAALTVQGAAARCWWATKMARLVLDGVIAPKETGTFVVTANFAPLAYTSSQRDGDLVLVLTTGLDARQAGRIMSPSTVLAISAPRQSTEIWMPPVPPETWTTNNTGIQPI